MFEPIEKKFPEPEKSFDQAESLKRIELKCDAIIQKLDLIFGDHVFINSRLVRISDLKIKYPKGGNEGEK